MLGIYVLRLWLILYVPACFLVPLNDLLATNSAQLVGGVSAMIN